MKIAITSENNSIEGTIDKHFARCHYFVIFDTVNKGYEFMENTNRTLQEDVGITVIEQLRKLNIKKIISGEFGIKVKTKLEELEIQMIVITDHNKKIKEIIDLLRNS